MLFPGLTLDKQLANRPQDVKFCKKCTLSNQRPRITFDANGVCSACNYAAEKENSIDWADRENQLAALLSKHRSKDGSYDVIVPGSGGKDTVYVTGVLKNEYSMHPLCVTWSPFEYTEIGRRNFDAWNKYADVITMFPNKDHHAKLARLAFELLGDPWQPFTYGQKAYAMQMAVRFKVPLIFYGESGEVEYGGSEKNKAKPFESPEDWNNLYFKGAGLDTLLMKGVEAELFTLDDVDTGAFSMYSPPTPNDMFDLGAQMHWMSYYRPWDSVENYEYARQLGFKAADVRSEGTYTTWASLDDKQDGFHHYPTYAKFGTCRCTSDLAGSVRAGLISRDDAIDLIRDYDGEFPSNHYAWFLDHLGITDAEFWEVIDFYRGLSGHLWAKRGDKWVLKHTIWGGEKEI